MQEKMGKRKDIPTNITIITVDMRQPVSTGTPDCCLTAQLLQLLPVSPISRILSDCAAAFPAASVVRCFTSVSWLLTAQLLQLLPVSPISEMLSASLAASVVTYFTSVFWLLSGLGSCFSSFCSFYLFLLVFPTSAWNVQLLLQLLQLLPASPDCCLACAAATPST